MMFTVVVDVWLLCAIVASRCSLSVVAVWCLLLRCGIDVVAVYVCCLLVVIFVVVNGCCCCPLVNVDVVVVVRCSLLFDRFVVAVVCCCCFWSTRERDTRLIFYLPGWAPCGPPRYETTVAPSPQQRSNIATLTPKP